MNFIWARTRCRSLKSHRRTGGVLDVCFPIFNDLVSGFVAGKSSAIYLMVLNEVLREVFDRRPVPILVPESLRLNGHEAAQIDSLIYRYFAGYLMMDVDILAFSAHPDDAELGCGGSLILAADRGLRVVIADLSAGEMSSQGTPEQRQNEKERASEKLGLWKRLSVGLPDGKIGTDPLQRLPVIQLIRDLKPRLVLAPHSPDRHPDHEGASRLVKEACFLAGVTAAGTGHRHRPEWIYYYMIHTPFVPSLVVDISGVWERKRAAIAAYQSQFTPGEGKPSTAIGRPDFLRFIEAQAIVFGAMIGASYGEAFHLPGPVALRGLLDVKAEAPSRSTG